MDHGDSHEVGVSSFGMPGGMLQQQHVEAAAPPKAKVGGAAANLVSHQNLHHHHHQHQALHVGFGGSHISLGLSGGIRSTEAAVLAQEDDNDDDDGDDDELEDEGTAADSTINNNNGSSGLNGSAKPARANINNSNTNSAGGHDVKLPSSMELKLQARKGVKYRECLKNHAANLGGHATDGCGEFMPSGEEGTLEALRCAACSCHRNFHRREVEGEPACDSCSGGYPKRSVLDSLFAAPLALPPPPPPGGGMQMQLQQPQPQPPPPPHRMFMAYHNHVPDSPDREYDAGLGLGGHGHHHYVTSSGLKKRFRTKFSPEQKEQMHAFSEKLGWRIQKQDEAAVQQFCADVGVKRHVLKVWMHNNKHALSKRNGAPAPSPPPPLPPPPSPPPPAALLPPTAAAALTSIHEP